VIERRLGARCQGVALSVGRLIIVALLNRVWVSSRALRGTPTFSRDSATKPVLRVGKSMAWNVIARKLTQKEKIDEKKLKLLT
jgi:hypothetical protein